MYYNSVVLGSLLVFIISLIVYNLPFAVVDLTGQPVSLTKYKVQDSKKTPVGFLGITTVLHSYIYIIIYIIQYNFIEVCT